MQGRPSLVLITVDCLRADHVGFMGYPRPTTPFLDTLANESVVVSTAIVAGAPTYYSFPAIFASRYPLDLGRDVVGWRGARTVSRVRLRMPDTRPRLSLRETRTSRRALAMTKASIFFVTSLSLCRPRTLEPPRMVISHLQHV